VIKRILGGKRGNSGGKVNRALKKPPSLEIDIRIWIWNITGVHEYTLESIRGAFDRISDVSIGIVPAKLKTWPEGSKRGREANPIIITSHS